MMNYSSQTLPQFTVNRFTLAFRPDIEREFQKTHYEKALPQVRIALLVAICVYAVFGFLDAIIFPEVKYILWTIRFAGVIPFILAVYIFSFSSHFTRFINLAPAAVILLAGIGIIGMILVAPTPKNSLYYAGLILVFIYGYTFFKIRFIWATLTGLLIVIAYEISAIWLSDPSLEVLLSNNFFFLGGNLIGMFASYSIEWSSRQDFIQTYLLEIEKGKVDTLNRELENRVIKRTNQLVQANRELLDEMAERRLAEEKYLTLFEESKDAVFITSPDGPFIDLNPAGVELFGYASKREILQLDITRDIYANPDDRMKFKSLMQSQGHVQDFELNCKKKDGTRITVLVTATVVRDPSGKIITYQGIIRDITEKKELERQLVQSQKMESIGLLAGGIAHDLNNVLTPITMSIQLLENKLEDADSLQLLKTLESNANRGADIVKQVLTFARGAGTELTTVDPKKLVDEIGGIIEHTFPKNIEFRIEYGENLKMMRGNATQLHQVLLNLAINARDAMNAGGRLLINVKNVALNESVTRLYEGAEPGEFVRIGMIDTGSGIPPKIMEKIFDPFFTTKEVGRGTGLGLSVIRGIIKSHSGILQVDSEVGKGSEFMVYLPVDKGTAPQSLSATFNEIPVGNHEIILVIDDEESIRFLAKEILEAHNYHVLTAQNGHEALALYADKKSEIHMVITDMLMPGMDGAAVIAALRELDADVPIIITSGLTSDVGLIDSGLEQSIQATIAKPYAAQTLLKTIHEVLH